MLCAVERARPRSEAAPLCGLLLVREAYGRADKGRRIDRGCKQEQKSAEESALDEVGRDGLSPKAGYLLRLKAGEDPLGFSGADFGQKSTAGVFARFELGA